jgi:hypothetical protein
MNKRWFIFERAVVASVAAIYTLSAPSVVVAATNSSPTIRVAHTVSVDRVRPSPKKGIVAHHNYTVTLSGENTVTTKRDSRSGRDSSQQQSSRNLGVAGKKGALWTVASSNEIVRRLDYPQSYQILRITVTGPNTCVAKVDYVLKPGFTEYTLPRLVSGEIAYYTA